MSEEWTLASLKHYIEQRFNDQGEAIKTAMSAAEKAVDKAEKATEKRFDSVNEFRKTLSDQAALFLQRGEYMAASKALVEKVEKMEKVQNYLIGGLVMLTFFEPIIVTIIGRIYK